MEFRYFKGEAFRDAAECERYARDTSIFERVPEVVVYPKSAEELSDLVKDVRDAREKGAAVSITARAAGTDMTGGPLTTSIVAVFTKYMNRVLEVGDSYAVTEPGVYYRDFEKATLERGLILPSYPASREIAAMGGIVANDAGGERSLKYGKTQHYVEELECVLSDGSVTTFKALTQNELKEKLSHKGLEGDIYRGMLKLVSENAGLIEAKRPKVSKNSAGYALWAVQTADGGMNLAKLICGSQGTLALWTKAKLSLVRPKGHRAMLVVFLTDLTLLPEVVRRVLPLDPESFESYDDHTFTLAIRFLPEMLMQMGFAKAARLGISFIPEAEMVLTGGVPKLILMAEFAEDTIEAADAKAAAARETLHDMPVQTKIEKNERESEKYWIVRRESFRLLRQNLHGRVAAPFIDDLVVPPESYSEFLPKLDALLKRYEQHFIYTIAGHIGNGNFHIIPLMDLGKPLVRQVVLDLAPKVYDLVIEYGGTTTGEHNDGIIRTPYLTQLFGEEMVRLFEETKNIFDPLNLFNPGKKVGLPGGGGTFEDITRDMIDK